MIQKDRANIAGTDEPDAGSSWEDMATGLYTEPCLRNSITAMKLPNLQRAAATTAQQTFHQECGTNRYSHVDCPVVNLHLEGFL